MNDGIQVIMTKCYYCLENNTILMNRRVGHKDKRLEEMNGKVIDAEPCSRCAKFMQDGIILITIDYEKSDEGWDDDKTEIPNPHRTGGFFVVTEDALKRIMAGHESLQAVLDLRWAFVDHKLAEAIGLFDAAKDKDEQE
jgi:hypothetical protein